MSSQPRPKLPVNLIAFWLMVASACQVLAVDPIVSNVQVKQREESRLVDISYDVVDPDSPALTVYLKVSPDGGKTWKGPVELVTGDVGRHVPPGAAKRLVWDAGKEMPNQFGAKFRYRIGASDQWLGEPGMEFVPAGQFQMGDDRFIAAIPLRFVTVSSFAIDKWEVSIELWNRVQKWGSTHGYDLEPGISYGAKHPVHSVSWFDAVKWNNARSEMVGQVPVYYEDPQMTIVYRKWEKEPKGLNWSAGYRLPTAAEWEKAARGDVVGKFYSWGTDKINSNLANYNNNKNGTTPIGAYSANGYGLFDMTGNLCEWCWDWSGVYPSTTLPDPRGPNSGSYRVISGGSWDFDGESCRISTSIDNVPQLKGGNVGFRSVLCSGQP